VTRATTTLAVLNYDGRELLERTLPSVVAQRGGEASVLVLDNGSSDDSRDYLEREWPQVRTVALERNVGVAAALNRCVQEARTQYVALLNNDVELDPRWLEHLLAPLEEDPAIVSASGKMLRWDRREVIDTAGDSMRWSGAVVNRGRGELDRGQYDVAGPVLSACAGAALYRRSAFADVGPFDEDFWSYLEDVDWGLRARLAGFESRYEPAAIAFHMGGATTGRDWRRYAPVQRRNLFLLVLKDYPAGALLRHGPRVGAFAFLQALASVRDGIAREHARALGEVVRGLRRTLGKRRTIQRQRRIGVAELDALMARGWGVEASPRAQLRLLRQRSQRA
jgi:GT2 family glycosyltransferase